ncbi:type I-E CRISPR-associated protein Cas6/Cse3/CasE [Nitrospirillum viridazoti]|uniref:CRISPR system Cascade subunit CasE n=1 Tax=Nitrospirillum amazonense TaxID=28077 RepID=A0A560J006_9PROT|nr:type I-E CRISPR-associated protein Cas6/Cse3/CasE [Nitrospirillum amazonense]TWB64417.1 CRISPR system Cascade subunit CasE [Nitrospirillum amazonense]
MTDLHMIRLSIDLPELSRWAADRNLGWTAPRGGDFDEGRALHHLLTETFGQARLQPFRLIATPQARRGHLYAYCRATAAELTDEAQAIALPEHLKVCLLGDLAEKPMPAEWRVGRRMGFETRVRPVRRLLRPLAGPDGHTFEKGDEVDAFLVDTLRHTPGSTPEGDAQTATTPEREAVYGTWLGERLAGAADLSPGIRLTRFSRHRAVRKGGTPEGPDAVLQGDLTITGPEAFQRLLEKGVGRHRAYGFGMMMLRPAGR